LRSLLIMVQSVLLRLRDDGTAYIRHHEELCSLLSAVEKNVLELDSKIEYQLKGSEQNDQLGRPTVSKRSWLRAAPEVERMRHNINHACSRLQLALTALNTEITL